MTGTQSPPLSLTCDWNRHVSCTTQTNPDWNTDGAVSQSRKHSHLPRADSARNWHFSWLLCKLIKKVWNLVFGWSHLSCLLISSTKSCTVPSKDQVSVGWPGQLRSGSSPKECAKLPSDWKTVFSSVGIGSISNREQTKHVGNFVCYLVFKIGSLTRTTQSHGMLFHKFVTVFECCVEVWTVSGHSILSNATFWNPLPQTT